MKRIINLIMTSGLVIFFLTGCVAVQTASLEKDSKAKLFVTDEKLSNVYLYRNENFGMAIGMPVVVDGKIAGKTGAKSFFNWKLEPGEHVFKSLTENTSVLNLKTEAGKNYFIWQEVKMGMWSARSLLQEVSSEIGEKGVNECKLLESEF